jgi:hypothetical protein
LNLRDRALRDHFPTLPPGARTEIDDRVRATHRILVVLDHDERISLSAQGGERIEELLVITRVQADGRLVEDVETPRRFEPSCAASRMRWDSPPLSVFAERFSAR